MFSDEGYGAGIPRREILKAATLGVAALAMPGCRSAAKSVARRPNVIFILVDDLGWRDVGFLGSEYYETPNIDRLAREGMIFSDAYAAAPNCAPSRASLLTGQYTPRHGVYTVGSSERGRAEQRRLVPIANRTTLAPEHVTIAEVLADAGYATAMIGKWHLGDTPDHDPLSQGFHVNVAGNTAGHPRSYFSPYGNKDLPDGPAGEYLTDRLTEESLRFIEANRVNPFFLYLSHYAVHTPIQAKQELTARYRDRPASNGQNNPIYAAMIESVDQGIGRILDKLAELAIDENTVVVFYSDNGGHGRVTSMQPLRGAKGMLYEGGIRVPMAVRRPGSIKAGSRCAVPVTMVDFFPTILEFAGVTAPADLTLDGETLVPLLRGGTRLSRDAIFWHFPAYLESGRGAATPWRTTPAGAIRQGGWKLIEFFEDGTIELFYLEDDIGESRDLSGSMPEKAETLHRLLQDWRMSVGALVPTELNQRYREQPTRGQREPGKRSAGALQPKPRQSLDQHAQDHRRPGDGRT